jgi:hypothetical protein
MPGVSPQVDASVVKSSIAASKELEKLTLSDLAVAK